MFAEIIVLVLLWIVWSLMIQWFLRFWTGALTANYFDDPIYKRNVRQLIERNRKFEEEKR